MTRIEFEMERGRVTRTSPPVCAARIGDSVWIPRESVRFCRSGPQSRIELVSTARLTSEVVRCVHTTYSSGADARLTPASRNSDVRTVGRRIVRQSYQGGIRYDNRTEFVRDPVQGELFACGRRTSRGSDDGRRRGRRRDGCTGRIYSRSTAVQKLRRRSDAGSLADTRFTSTRQPLRK